MRWPGHFVELLMVFWMERCNEPREDSMSYLLLEIKSSHIINVHLCLKSTQVQWNELGLKILLVQNFIRNPLFPPSRLHFLVVVSPHYWGGMYWRRCVQEWRGMAIIAENSHRTPQQQQPGQRGADPVWTAPTSLDTSVTSLAGGRHGGRSVYQNISGRFN